MPYEAKTQRPHASSNLINPINAMTQKRTKKNRSPSHDHQPATVHQQQNIDKAREAFLSKDYSRGFIKYCQFKAGVIRRGYFESRVAIQEHHRQQDGFIHAGVMATMADHTAGYAAFTTVTEEFQILTIEFKINFLRPAFGKGLLCRSRVIREGSQLIISESEVFDQREGKETLVAKAMVTLMPVHKEKLLREKARVPLSKERGPTPRGRA